MKTGCKGGLTIDCQLTTPDNATAISHIGLVIASSSMYRRNRQLWGKDFSG